MRRFAILAGLGLWAVACDKEPAATPQDAGAADSSAPSAAPLDATAPSARPATSVAMPARPVPKTSPTVTQGMSQEVQMQAIQYMVAMETPHPDDANADTTWAKQLADQLAPIARTFERGNGAKNRVEVVASGRKIDVYLGHGCEAEVPSRISARAGVSLATMLLHGVLVLRCADDHGQCLQSTRDPDDILCTIVPRRNR